MLVQPVSLCRPLLVMKQTYIASGRGKETDATSISGVLSLGLRQGDSLNLRASGKDAEAAIEALSELVRVNFYETTPEVAIPPTVGADLSGTPPIYRPDTHPETQLPGEPWHGYYNLSWSGCRSGSSLYLRCHHT